MSEETNYVPFKMVIKDYKFDGSFFVEFTPDDPTLTPYTYTVQFPFNEDPSPSKDEIISRIAGASPQDFWRYEIESKNFDASIRKSLIDLEFENAQDLIPKNLLPI